MCQLDRIEKLIVINVSFRHQEVLVSKEGTHLLE